MTAWHSLAGKTIWVTGGAGYLGAPIVAALDQECDRVVCFDLAERAQALVAERGLARTTPETLDFSDAATLPGALDAMLGRYGLPDGLVHLVYRSSSGKALEALTPADFQATFDFALTPTFVLCRHLADRMKVRGSGSIVLFSSMYGLVSPDPGIYRAPMLPNPIDYGASKAAVLQLSRYLAVHYGSSGVRFNCITPGPFPNSAVQKAHPAFMADLGKKTALRRIGQNAEIVGPTLFLLTDSASFVTGHSLVVDGGWTAW